MPAVIERQRFGPETYFVASDATGAAQVVGGRLVEFHATETGKVKLAAADTATFLGVALYDAHPGQNASTTGPSGFPTFDYSTIQPEVPVAWTGVFKLQFVGTANPGDLVYPAADGQVKTAVGTATRPVGIVSQATAVANNGTGYVRLF